MENKKSVGRPKKWFTEEERKEAKKISNSREEEKERRREYKRKTYALMKEKKNLNKTIGVIDNE